MSSTHACEDFSLASRRRRQAAILPPVLFSVDEQAEALIERQTGHGGIRLLFLERRRHAG